MKDFFLTRTLLISLIVLFSSVLPAAEANLEYKIKAGYLYNFTKFITWPELKSPTFNLCIVGADPFGPIIDPIEKKTAFARSIKIIRLPETEYLAFSEAKFDCHILYLGETSNPKTVLEKTRHPKKTATLIVGEQEELIQNGEMINFVNRDGKIKLQINLQSVKQSELKISAKLLEIAELVSEPYHEK